MKPGWKTTEFALSLVILLSALLLATRGDITAQQFFDLAWKVVGAYSLARGLKKLGEGRRVPSDEDEFDRLLASPRSQEALDELAAEALQEHREGRTRKFPPDPYE